MRWHHATVAVALVACGHAARGLHEAVMVEAMLVPRDSTPRELAVCADGNTYVPRAGGLAIAGTGAWLIPPGAVPITSVACDDASNLFYVRGNELVAAGPAGAATIAMPEGVWHVVGAPAANVWLYGQLPDGRGAILHYDHEHELGAVYVGPKAIRALAAVDTTVAAVLDRDLIVWHGDAEIDLGVVGPNVDGLAIDADGTLFVSGPAGIVRVRSGEAAPVVVAEKIHGGLRILGAWLYVSWHDGSSVLRIAPHPEEIVTKTVAVHRNFLVDGPASDRKESLDFGISVFTMSKTAPVTLNDSNPVDVTSATLGDVSFQGASGEFNAGPMLSRHLFAGVQMRLATGSAPVLHVTTTPNAGGGTADASASLFEFGARVPVGLRLPLGWVSLSFGSGIEVALLDASVWKSASGIDFPLSSRGLAVPLWARFEAELGCMVGAYAQVGDSIGIGDVPDFRSIELGLTFRSLRTCY